MLPTDEPTQADEITHLLMCTIDTYLGEHRDCAPAVMVEALILFQATVLAGVLAGEEARGNAIDASLDHYTRQIARVCRNALQVWYPAKRDA